MVDDLAVAVKLHILFGYVGLMGVISLQEFLSEWRWFSLIRYIFLSKKNKSLIKYVHNSFSKISDYNINLLHRLNYLFSNVLALLAFFTILPACVMIMVFYTLFTILVNTILYGLGIQGLQPFPKWFWGDTDKHPHQWDY